MDDEVHSVAIIVGIGEGFRGGCGLREDGLMAEEAGREAAMRLIVIMATVMLAGCSTVESWWSRNAEDVLDKTTGSTTTTTTIPAPADDVPWADLVWQTGNVRPNLASTIDASVSLTNVRVDVRNVYYDFAGHWPDHDGTGTPGVECLFLWRDNAWRGGQFDHARFANGRIRPTWQHVQGGGGGFYKGWDVLGPYTKGEDVLVVIFRPTGTERTRVVRVTVQ